jgi:SanA protein
MSRTWTRGRIALTMASLLLLGGLALAAPRAWTRMEYADRRFERVADVPASAEPRVAIVLGAGIAPNGGPSPVLYDRVVTAAELYKTGKVRKLLLTGDNRYEKYNEPEVMRRTALALGVPDDALVLDYAGRRTYDSCYRAKAVFGVTRAIVVTQAFHLDRSLYLCDALGIDAVGVVADRQAYPSGPAAWWNMREFVATAAAWADLNVIHPTPILGDPIPIDQ